MRLSLPERFPLPWAVAIAFILAVLEVSQHTSLPVVGLLFVFEVLWVFNFNLAGGFTSATGAYIFWYGSLTIVVGSLIKIVIGDAVDYNTFAAVPTIGIYAIGMMLMTPIIYIVRVMLKGRPSIAQRFTPPGFDYRAAAIGSLILALLPNLIFPFLPLKFATAIVQVNYFGFFAIILGTVDAIRSSGGRSAFTWVNGAAVATMFFFGIVGFGKEGMFTPLVLWLITCVYVGFRFRMRHLLSILAIGFVYVYFLVPISQVGRTRDILRYGTSTDRLTLFVQMATDIQATRAEYITASEDSHSQSTDFFSKDVGIAARFTRWSSDDPLVAYTLEGHTLGYAWIRYCFLNWVPHLILPNKSKNAPDGGGNYYAREMGLLPSDDTSTGISFGAPTEAFHLGGLPGVFFLLPLCWLLFFLSIDLMCGDLRTNPWGIWYLATFAHLGPESAVTGLIYSMWYSNLALFVGIFFGTRIAPLIGSFFSGQVPLGGLSERPLGQMPRTQLT